MRYSPNGDDFSATILQRNVYKKFFQIFYSFTLSKYFAKSKNPYYWIFSSKLNYIWLILCFYSYGPYATDFFRYDKLQKKVKWLQKTGPTLFLLLFSWFSFFRSSIIKSENYSTNGTKIGEKTFWEYFWVCFNMFSNFPNFFLLLKCTVKRQKLSAQIFLRCFKVKQKNRMYFLISHIFLICS